MIEYERQQLSINLKTPHSGRKYSVMIAGTEQFKKNSNCYFNQESGSSQEPDSIEQIENDELDAERFFNRKRIK